MHGSTAPLPSDLFEFAVLDYHRNRRVSVRRRQHLFPVFEIVLGVEIFKRDSLAGVEFASFLTVRTAGFRIDFYLQAFLFVGDDVNAGSVYQSDFRLPSIGHNMLILRLSQHR